MLYTVQDTTMTALGDAIRKNIPDKYIGTTIKNEPFYTFHFDSRNYDMNSWEMYGGNPMYRYFEAVKFNPKEALREYEELNIFNRLNMFIDYKGTIARTPDIMLNPQIYGGGALQYLVREYDDVLEIKRETGYSNNSFVYDKDWYIAIIIEKDAITQGLQFEFDVELRAMMDETNFITLNKFTPAEMIDTINSWDMTAIDRYKYFIEGKTYFSIPASDLTGITEIRNQTAYNFPQINGLELPEGITKIGEYAFTSTTIKELVLPASLSSIKQHALTANTSLTTVRILNDKNVITIEPLSPPFTSCSQLNSIYIPSKLYDQYCSSSGWMNYKDKFIPYGEWVFDKNLSTYLAYNNEKEYSISLLDFKQTPEFSITLDKNECAEITDIFINDDNTEITFKVKALNSDGVETLTITVYGEEQIYTLTGTITVMETVPEPTYEVVAVDGASYGFALNDNGYYESQNKGKQDSYALCQVNISNLLGMPVYFDCINSGEANYDFGLLGVVNYTLLLSGNVDSKGIMKNFKGNSSNNIQSVKYTDANGDCFIQVKFRKDSSGDQGNDSLQFKIRFGE